MKNMEKQYESNIGLVLISAKGKKSVRMLSSDVTDVTFPTSADADADLHNPKQNACVTIEFSEI